MSMGVKEHFSRLIWEVKQGQQMMGIMKAV